MIKKELICSMAVSVLIGGFVAFPVFAEETVDIDIVEMTDDGSGNLVPWEDIVDAVPGMTYSAIPRVKNNGSVAVTTRMCLSESGVGPDGDVIELKQEAFVISINDDYWTLDVSEMSNSVLNICYIYNTNLIAGATTEPLFYEVSLSNTLGNEYKNATFSLHLHAYAIGGNNSSSSESSENLPSNPDTGAATNSGALTVGGYISLSAGLVILVAMIVYLVKQKA